MRYTHAVHLQQLQAPPDSVTPKTNKYVLPFSCSGDTSTAHIASGHRLEYSCSDYDDAWSSVDGQYTDQTPESVIVQQDEQCDSVSHSERVILARTFLCDELPATDNLDPRTVPRLSALAQADYTVPVAPQPGFPFSQAMINHFQKNTAGITNHSRGQITPNCFAPERPCTLR